MSKTTTFLSARCFLRLKIPLWSLSIRQNCSAEMDKLKSVSSTKKISEIIILICYDLTWTRERTLYIESNFLPRLNKNQASNTNGFFHHNGSRGHWRSWEIIIDSPACMGHEKRSKQTTIKKQNIKQQKKKLTRWSRIPREKTSHRKQQTTILRKTYSKNKKEKELIQTSPNDRGCFPKNKKTNKQKSINQNGKQTKLKSHETKNIRFAMAKLKKTNWQKWIERCTLTP